MNPDRPSLLDDLAARRLRATAVTVPPEPPLTVEDTAASASPYAADDVLVTRVAEAPLPASPAVTIPSEADRLERVSGPAALATSETWETAPQPPLQPAYDAATGTAAAGRFAAILERLAPIAGELSEALMLAGPHWTEQQDGVAFAAAVDTIERARRELAQVQAMVALAAGRAVRDRNMPRDGVLPSGEAFEIVRGKDRKAWQHDAWKRDVRARILDATTDLPLVNPTTGEEVDLRRIVSAAVETAQSVHGSAGPKVTALRALRLDPGDYSEGVAGPWAIRVSGSTEGLLE